MAIESGAKSNRRRFRRLSRPRKGKAQQNNTPPDAGISLNLIEMSGFWTTVNITVMAIAGGVVIVTLLVFLVLAGRAGLLRRQTW